MRMKEVELLNENYCYVLNLILKYLLWYMCLFYMLDRVVFNLITEELYHQVS